MHGFSIEILLLLGSFGYFELTNDLFSPTPVCSVNLWKGNVYLLQAKAQHVTGQWDGALSSFEVTQGQSLTGNYVVTDQVFKTTRRLPIHDLHTHTNHIHVHVHTQCTGNGNNIQQYSKKHCTHSGLVVACLERDKDCERSIAIKITNFWLLSDKEIQSEEQRLKWKKKKHKFNLVAITETYR